MARPSLPKKARKPYLQPMMLAIQAAMRKHDLDMPGLVAAMGLDPAQYPAVYNWVVGKNGPNPKMRTKLALALDLTEAQLTSPNPTGSRGKRIAPPTLGPAQRAVALVQAAPPGAVPTVTAEPVRDVWNIVGRSDGSVAVQMRTVLDRRRGMTLARLILDFDLAVGGDSDRE